MKIDKSTIPMIVRDYPGYIQQAYIREFQRVEDETHNAAIAEQEANKLFKALVKGLLMQPRFGVSIIAGITEMAVEEVIPRDLLKQIRDVDPHPFFAIYDVGGEGVSSGSINGKKERKLWSFAAIKELAKKLQEGNAGIIIGHNQPNQDVKPKYGRLVYAFTKKIKDSLHTLAVAYIYNKDVIQRIKAKELDVCSIEGDVVLARENPKSSWFIRSIQKIQNLALGSSSISSPGFVGAGIVATIQELSKNQEI